MPLTVGSCFSGIGGFDTGFERAGMNMRWQIEIDAQCNQVLGRHWPEVQRFDDITKVSGLPAVDVLCGGFPCQDLSVAGRRAGLVGERSSLFHQFARLAAELRPTWLVIENVPGLRSSFSSDSPPPRDLPDGGWETEETSDLGVVLSTLGQLGYGWAYRTCDAQYDGVAQRRHRIFIVGHPRVECAAQVLFEPESCDWHPAPSRETREDAAHTLRSRAKNPGVSMAGRGEEDKSNLVVRPQTFIESGMQEKWVESSCAGKPAHEAKEPHTLVFESRFVRNGRGAPEQICPPLKAQSGRTGKGDSAPLIAHTLRAEGSDASEDGTGRGVPMVVDTTQISSSKNYSNPKPGDPCHPLANDQHPPLLVQPTVRRLTPTECERLMSFPDGWTDNLSDSARYRVLGNAVVVNVAEWIGRRIVALGG